MNLTQSIIYADEKLKEGHKSDGCTFSPDFWIKKCCQRHDMLRRFKPITASRADCYYLLLMLKRLFPLAPLYYLAVVIARKTNVFK